MISRINYSKVIKQANSISDDADDLKAVIVKLTKYKAQCQSAWKGETADAFVARLDELITQMSRTRIQMEDLAVTITECADLIKKEDEQAAENAASLSSGL